MPITYDRKSFFDAVRDSVFDGWMSAKQVDGLGAILDGWEKLQPTGDTRFLAYSLSTAKWETASTMQPIEEYGHGRGRSYGVPAGPWHQVYDGKGLVQDTWYANYVKQDPKLHALGILEDGESIVRTPALVMRPDVASAIMFYGMMEGWFTGKKLADYFHGAASDWVGARRIINGTDHAADVAALAEHFFAALKASVVITVDDSKPKPLPPAALAVTPIAPVTPAPVAMPVSPSVNRPRPARGNPPAPALSLFARLALFFAR